eukprot:ANDGO_06966.mRNA.1 putative dimethyladenosine transferase
MAARRERSKPNKSEAAAFSMDKSLGQHLLKNPAIVTTIVQKADIMPTDTVLEIGPGTGNLTVKLLEAAKKVVVVEVDPRMVVELTKRIQAIPHLYTKLEIIHSDVLKCDFPYFDVCVANIPYQISSAITFKLLSHRPTFRSAVLMFQHEFAMRIVAKPNDPLYCRLAVNSQLLARCSHVMKISKANFRPPPKVDSSVVKLEPYSPAPPVNFIEWDGLVRLCFSRKNKTLAAIFKSKEVIEMLETNYRTFCAASSTPCSASSEELDMKTKVIGLLEEHGFAEKRSSKMDQDDFMYILAIFNKNNLHFT